MNKNIQKAVEIVKQGGIIIYPTDTAFGIGCRIDREDSIKRLFELRRRPENKAMPVLVDSIEMAQEYVKPIPQKVKELLASKYWPGALTIILPCLVEKVPSFVRGGGMTIGVRIPDNEIIRSIIKGVGVPILGSSANFAGEKTPYSVEDLDPELVKLVDLVVPGICSIKQPSTVIDCSINPWKIVREGAIKLSIENL